MKPFTAKDICCHKVISIDANASSSRVVHVVKKARQRDDYSRRVWSSQTIGHSETRPLTSADESATSPGLRGDAGELAFLSDRGKRIQVHILDLDAYRIRGRWGELDLPQVMSIVEQLQASRAADDRIACAGKSYGGFMSAWAIGHSSVFRAAVVCAPVANIASHAGTSDTGYYVTPLSMGADLNEDPECYRRLCPDLLLRPGMCFHPDPAGGE